MSSIASSSSCRGYTPIPSTTSPITTRYRTDRAISSSPASHSDTFDHLSSRNVRLPTWMSDMNAARTWPRAPRNGREVGMSGRTTDFAIRSPRSLTIPTTPTTSSITTGSAARPESAGRRTAIWSVSSSISKTRCPFFVVRTSATMPMIPTSRVERRAFAISWAPPSSRRARTMFRRTWNRCRK